MSDPLSDKCAYCGSPAVMDDAWFCSRPGCWAAYEAECRAEFVRAERDRYRRALERIASHPLVAKSSDPAVQVDQMRLYASGALAPASDGEGA